jgi:chromosome segregation ATPase
MRETIQKLLKQRNAARADFDRLSEGLVPKADQEAVESALANAEAKLRRLEEEHEAKYAAIKAHAEKSIASAHADLTAQVESQQKLIDNLTSDRSRLLHDLYESALKTEKLENEFAEMRTRYAVDMANAKQQIDSLKGEDVKALRKRLHAKTEYVKEQERYIRSLTTTIKHFMRHPAIVEYVAAIQKSAKEQAELASAGVPSNIGLSPEAVSIVKAEETLAAKPVEVEAT